MAERQAQSTAPAEGVAEVFDRAHLSHYTMQNADLEREILGLFLMQLPWHLIDYVLLHELTHTKYMQHGPIFWAAMNELEPKTKFMRIAMKQHHPILQ